MIPKRYVLTLLMSLGMGNLFSLRNSLNIALIAMVKYRNSNDTISEGTQCTYGSENRTTNILVEEGGPFDWDEYVQSMVLGSFYYGYVISNFFGGYLAERFGGKIVFFIGVFLTSALNLLGPVLANISYKYFIVLRVLMGLAEGITQGSMVTLCAKWYTTTESAFLYSFVQLGGRLGNVVATPITAVLCKSLGGWQSPYYFFGGLGVLYSICWFVFIYENPSDHPTISPKELKYLIDNQGDTGKVKCKTPWKKILLSSGSWVLIVSGFAESWGYTLLLTDSPTFLNQILKFDLNSNALLNSLPYLITMATVLLSGYLSKVIIHKEWLSITNTRKLMHFIGCFGASALMLGVTFVGCDRISVLVLLYASEAVNGFLVVGVKIAIMDFAPSYAGTLFSLCNGLANLSGILAPLMVGYLTDNNQTLEQWHKAFYITIAISIFCCLLFVIFGTSKLQPWGKETEDGQKEKVIETKTIQNVIENTTKL